MMDWRRRTDLWYGGLLLRPQESLKTAEFGGAYVEFAVIAGSIDDAIDRVFVAVRAEQWQPASILTMKRAWDYHDDEDEDEIIARRPRWLDLIELAERDGLSLGAIDRFRIDRRRIDHE